MSADNLQPARKSAPWWVRFAAWAVAGGIFGYAVGRFLPSDLPDLDASALIAALIALLFAVPGILVLLGCVIAPLGIAMKMFADREAWEDERRLTANSGVGCLLIALFLLLLITARPLGWLAVETAFVLSLLLGVAASWFTWRTWALMDELWRRVSAEATVVAFYLVLVPGLAWSLAAHLQLVAPLAPLDWISLILAATLIASVIATARRGMLEDRL